MASSRSSLPMGRGVTTACVAHAGRGPRRVRRIPSLLDAGVAWIALNYLLNVAERLLRHRGALLVGLAVWVLAVPTVFAEFPEAATWSLWVRIPIAVAWALSAVAAAAIATNQDEKLGRLIADSRQRVKVHHDRIVAAILESLLCDGAAGAPRSFVWTVFVFDEEADRLIPVFPEKIADKSDPKVFTVGTGVVGCAFAENGVVTAMGDAVSSGEFNLTSEQQEYFRRFKAVAGVALVDRAGRPFGGVTAICEDPDPYFEATAASEQLRDLAEVVAAVLLKFSSE